MSDPKSLMQYIVEAIDEALPPGSPMSGRDIYLLGFERWERENFERHLADRRRRLEAQMPLLAAIEET